MATTVPVLQIPIDDSQWREFLATFEKFKIDAADVPGAMAAIDRAVERLPEHLRPVTESLEDAADGAVDALEDAGIAGGGGGKGSGGGGGGKKRRSGGRKVVPAVALDWTLSALGARRFGSAITGATRDLARWERLTAVFAGLLGAGGLYGINALAARGAERRRESSGLGVSTGELASFETNYARLGDTSGILAGLSQAETDVTKRQPLQSLGVDPKGKSSLQIFGEMLPKLKNIADRADPNTFSASIRPYNLGALGIDERTMRLIRAMPREEIESMRRNAQRDVGQLGVPDDVGRKWQDLITTFHKAETRIQTALADDLVQLTPSLTHLSDTTVHLLDQLLSRKELKDWLERTNKGLLWFADEIGSEDAQTKFKTFLHHFDMAKSDFDALNNWLTNHSGLLVTTLAIGAGWRAAGPAGAAAAAVLVGGHYAGQAIDPLIPRLPAPQSGGRTLGDDLGLPGVDTPVPDKASQRDGGSPTTYEVTPADPSKPVPALNLKGSPFAHPDVEDVDPRLREILAAGQTHLPPGYTMRVNEGYNPNGHAPGSQHHIKGKGALDVVIFGPDGKPIANQGDEGQDGPYHRLARASYGEMLARHPELNKTFAWGGGFDSGRGDVKQDLMHFDLGGERANRYPENAMSRMGPLPEQLAKSTDHAGFRRLVKRLLATRDHLQKTEVLERDPNHSTTFTGPANARDRYALMVRQRNNLQKMLDKGRLKGPGWQSMLDKENQWLQDHQVPAEMRKSRRHMVSALLAPHPYTRPKPPQTVVVTDNSGGSSTVTVAH